LRGIFTRNSSPIWLRVKEGVMRTYYDFKIRRRGYHCFLIRHKESYESTRWDGRYSNIYADFPWTELRTFLLSSHLSLETMVAAIKSVNGEKVLRLNCFWVSRI